ncbi:DUF1275 family protein [Streptomyces incanus]|uniref:DUF1275 family protein n=1 Tax=Streptomyces incanus TaxID=887453 RepID=A0ABW0XU99_9ACTN
MIVGSRRGAAPAVERYRRWLLAPASVAAALTAIGLGTGTGPEPVPRYYLVIALTAVATGVCSATMWRLRAGLNTILVTGTLITWIRTSALGGGRRHHEVALPAVSAGAAIGTLLLRLSVTAALLIAAAGMLGGGPRIVVEHVTGIHQDRDMRSRLDDSAAGQWLRRRCGPHGGAVRRQHPQQNLFQR